MSLHTTKILGISVTTDGKETILEYIQKCLESGIRNQESGQKRTRTPIMIVTPNPEQVVLAQRDQHFAEIFNQADVAIPDGIGISLAAKILRDKRQEIRDNISIARIPGVEFMEDLVAIAAKRGYPVGLIGGRGGVAVRALECLQGKYLGLRGWVLDPGDVDLGNLSSLGNLREKIQKTNTRIIFVGLGAPKQEYFIARLARECQMSNVKFPIA